ncbi:MAG: dihydrolipoyl dehydrogenase [Bdellovibrionales bacterium]|nr:dihydrolipoyl dehydrogenase [Bdellovibrionales bacterium]
MASESYDLVIIGSGPGGYVGAVRAGQLGLKTAIVEKDPTFGGTCLNVGCIPSKALLDSSEHYAMAQHDFEKHGIDISGIKLNLDNMMARKDKIVKDLTGGVAFLFKKNKVTPYVGKGRVLSQNQVEVTAADGSKQILETKNIMLATGSVVNELPSVPYDGKQIISSTEALGLPRVPKHLIVIGGGVIGLELGSVWLRLGAKVTVLEYFDRLCPTMDAQLTKRMETVLGKQGMEFLLQVKVLGAKTGKDGVTITYEDQKDKSQKTIEGDVVLVATGRKPFSEGLGLEELGIEKDKRGFVLVNEHLQTKYPNVYAIGDLIPGPMLAHKAEEEGVAVAETIAGHAGHVNYETVPSVVYTWPELASVGQTEEQLKERGVQYKSGTFMFAPNGRAKAMGSTDGMVKVLADANTDRLLGVHILGPRASDMIAEAVVAMEFGGSAEDLARTFHAHPTLSEVLREAALAVDKRARQS